MVLTKTRYFLFLSIPRTSVMPSRAGELGRRGVQFHWKTCDPSALERLHQLVVQALRDEVDLTSLREIADIGKRAMSLGLGMPFIPEDAPLPECLKQISSYVKRVI